MCNAGPPGDIAARLLPWYDRHARALPWRVPPAARGVRPDPYRVWLSEIMLQQTTVAAVKGYFETFTARWPTVLERAAAEDADVMAAWAGLGYYARARNLLKCARVVAGELDGRFPRAASKLQSLPGIGPYTAAAIAAIAFDQPEAVVDGNVERVMARLFNVTGRLPGSKPRLRELAARLTPAERPGDYAQAAMDLGATICTPRSPACGICPLREVCKARAEGTAASLPRKAPKAPRPVRRGFVYLARTPSGMVLTETRAPSGLLGGMTAFPTSGWGEDPVAHPPLAADWQEVGEVRHTFTHFHLRLRVMVAEVAEGTAPDPDRGTFGRPDPSGLPTLMRKVHDLASDRGRTN